MKDTGKLPLPEPLLAVRDLSVAFVQGGRATPAVRGVSFDLYPGETLAIVGESGSGKSVTALSTVRLLPDNADITGSIRYRGTEMTDRRRAHPAPHPRQRHQLHLPGADDLA